MRAPAAIALLLLLASPGARAENPLASPWRTIAPGLEWTKAADAAADPRWGARMALLDPQRVRLLVRFDPQGPTLEQWRARYPDALAIMNGSFYSKSAGGAAEPTCDLVAKGRVERGAGCHMRDALFFGAQPALADAQALPRMMTAAEFRAADWSEALKSFPALVRANEPVCTAEGYCTGSSRTAALALLRNGHVLLFASQWPAIRQQVSQYLAGEMGALEALNLDGGPEATLWLRGDAPGEIVATPGVALPLVLVAEAVPAAAATEPRPSAH